MFIHGSGRTRDEGLHKYSRCHCKGMETHQHYQQFMYVQMILSEDLIKWPCLGAGCVAWAWPAPEAANEDRT